MPRANVSVNPRKYVNRVHGLSLLSLSPTSPSPRVTDARLNNTSPCKHISHSGIKTRRRGGGRGREGGSFDTPLDTIFADFENVESREEGRGREGGGAKVEVNE